MTAQTLPFRDVVRFLARAAQTAAQAARVVTTVATHIKDAPADSEIRRALRDLGEVHADLEITGLELESKLTTALLADDKRTTQLEERVNRVVAGLTGALASITAQGDRLAQLERLVGAAATAGTFRQLDDAPPPVDVFGQRER